MVPISSHVRFLHYRPLTKFAKVMFSQVSVCPQGEGCLPHCMLGYTPWADTPLARHRHPPWADTPLPSACWDTHLCSVHAGIHTPLHSACWDKVNKRAVRIPLECILVNIILFRHFQGEYLWCRLDELNTVYGLYLELQILHQRRKS